MDRSATACGPSGQRLVDSIDADALGRTGGFRNLRATRVDENTVTLKLVGQEIEGEPVPASDPISSSVCPKQTNLPRHAETIQVAVTIGATR